MDTKQKRQLTKSFILKPLHEALKDLEVTEVSVLKVFKDVLNNEKARDADKLRAVDLFVKWMGVVDNIEINIDTDIKAALDTLAAKREARRRHP